MKPNFHDLTDPIIQNIVSFVDRPNVIFQFLSTNKRIFQYFEEDKILCEHVIFQTNMEIEPPRPIHYIQNIRIFNKKIGLKKNFDLQKFLAYFPNLRYVDVTYCWKELFKDTRESFKYFPRLGNVKKMLISRNLPKGVKFRDYRWFEYLGSNLCQMDFSEFSSIFDCFIRLEVLKCLSFVLVGETTVTDRLGVHGRIGKKRFNPHRYLKMLEFSVFNWSYHVIGILQFARRLSRLNLRCVKQSTIVEDWEEVKYQPEDGYLQHYEDVKVKSNMESLSLSKSMDNSESKALDRINSDFPNLRLPIYFKLEKLYFEGLSFSSFFYFKKVRSLKEMIIKNSYFSTVAEDFEEAPFFEKVDRMTGSLEPLEYTRLNTLILKNCTVSRMMIIYCFRIFRNINLLVFDNVYCTDYFSFADIISEKNLSELSPKLKNLYFDVKLYYIERGFTKDSLVGMKRSEYSLKHLFLRLPSLECLKYIPNNDTIFSGFGMNRLEDYNIKIIKIYNTFSNFEKVGVEIDLLEMLDHLKNVEIIKFRNAKVTIDFKEFEKFSLDKSRLIGIEISHDCHFNMYSNIGSKVFIKLLNELKHLRYLSLVGCKISSEIFSTIRSDGFSKIEYLNLSNNNISENGLILILLFLRSLIFLDVSKNDITNLEKYEIIEKRDDGVVKILDTTVSNGLLVMKNLCPLKDLRVCDNNIRLKGLLFLLGLFSEIRNFKGVNINLKILKEEEVENFRDVRSKLECLDVSNFIESKYSLNFGSNVISLNMVPLITGNFNNLKRFVALNSIKKIRRNQLDETKKYCDCEILCSQRLCPIECFDVRRNQIHYRNRHIANIVDSLILERLVINSWKNECTDMVYRRSKRGVWDYLSKEMLRRKLEERQRVKKKKWTSLVGSKKDWRKIESKERKEEKESTEIEEDEKPVVWTPPKWKWKKRKRKVDERKGGFPQREREWKRKAQKQKKKEWSNAKMAKEKLIANNGKIQEKLLRVRNLSKGKEEKPKNLKAKKKRKAGKSKKKGKKKGKMMRKKKKLN